MRIFVKALTGGANSEWTLPHATEIAPDPTLYLRSNCCTYLKNSCSPVDIPGPLTQLRTTCSVLEGVHVPVPDSATFVCVDVAPEHSDDGRVDCRWERLRRERRHTLIKRQQAICTHLLSTADEVGFKSMFFSL